MAERKRTTSTQSAKKTTGKASKTFTAEERQRAERAREQKAAGKADGGAVLAKIAEMLDPDRTMAERLHAIIKASAPSLSPRTWYGCPPMPRTARSSASFKAAEVQDEVRDARPAQGEPRRRRCS
jgi:hypothetical protein